ncbi:MAG: chloride channel protein [Actinomycetota bacterium]|nr:chloride channel protein [Actinomycetota bacterium]
MSRRDELRAIGRRGRQVGLLASVTGALTGLAVAGFERLVNRGLFDHLLRLPLAVQAAAPAVGLLVAAAALHWQGRGASPATADEYIKSFHDRQGSLDLRPVLARLVASAATLGSGCALGYEGPSLYMGSALGTVIQRRLSKFFSREDSKVLLVAGAAAGVAAIFKAPATGAIFALEVPYQDDLARRMLLPVLFSAAASYVTFAAINGTTPLFPISGSPPFDLRDLGGAAVVGIVCGGAARLFARVLRFAKSLSLRGHPALRAASAGVAIAGLFAISDAVFGQSLILGSGYRSITWALEPRHAIIEVLALFVLRALATTAAVGGGGAGGLFVPLVVQGVILGRALGSLFGAGDTTLFPVLGIAAFLGAGYRVPLSAVVFVAETTGRPGFVVPGLIAAATAQLMMGLSSVSSYQHAVRRGGHLERRFALPITAALRTDAATVPPEATIEEFYTHHVLQVRLRVVPVVDGSAYLGMVHADDLTGVEREAWSTIPVKDVMRPDGPVGDVRWTLGQALAALEAGDSDRLAVLDGEAYVGLVTTGEILKLDEILDVTDHDLTD